MHMQVGTVRCRVRSTPWCHAETLADEYGARLEPDAGDDVDFELRIGEGPGIARAVSDRMSFEATNGRETWATDPLRSELRRDGGRHVVRMTVTDPGMRRDWLGYHFRVLFNALLLRFDRLFVHAAAVCVDGRVDVFCGHSGVGKSTLSVRLGLAGAVVLSDDSILARRRGDTFVVTGVSERARVTGVTEGQLLAGRLDDVPPDPVRSHKKAFAGSRFYDARPFTELVPDRLFLMKIGDAVAVRPARPSEAIHHVIDCSKWSHRFATTADHAKFLDAAAGFAASVPAYHLWRSGSLDDAPALLDALRDAPPRERS